MKIEYNKGNNNSVTFGSLPKGTCFRWDVDKGHIDYPFVNLKIDGNYFVEILRDGKEGNYNHVEYSVGFSRKVIVIDSKSILIERE